MTSERGATTVLVALMLSSVMVGMLILAADTGNLLWERRQLQNSADATSLRLAQICAKKLANCDATTTVTQLEAIGDKNAADGLQALDGAGRPATLNGQCGRVVGAPNLPQCASATTNADIANLRECPPLPDWLQGNSIKYVETYTRSESTGGPFMNFFFSKGADKAVTSCARAAWGPPRVASGSVAVTMSTCEWKTYTNSGATWVADTPVGAWPGYGGAGQPAYPLAATTPNTPGREVVIMLHDPSKPYCSFNGKDTAGGFGWLDPASGCTTNVTSTNGVDFWAEIKTGSSATGACQTYLGGIWSNGPVIDIPVFDCTQKSNSGTPSGSIDGKDCTGRSPASGGGNTYYHLFGMAKFYVSGYKIGGGPSTERASRVSGAVPCTGAQRCISGWFVKGELSSPSIVDTPPSVDLGVYSIVPAG